MRLLELWIQNFRGIGDVVLSFRTDRDLVLIYGPNGFGKTSIAEAVEWLFYGRTKRRQQGEINSKTEYAGTYSNAHRGRPVEVVARVLIKGKEHFLSRRLRDGAKQEESDTFVDGVSIAFGSLGIGATDGIHPVVAQHGLQTFIHTKPKDRRDVIGAALGLDEIISLKSALESSRAQFQRTPPSAVVQARKELTTNLVSLARLPGLLPLTERWQKSQFVTEDVGTLVKAANDLCAAATDTPEAALEVLRTKRAEVSRAVFDIEKLTPPARIDADLVSFREAAATAAAQFDLLGNVVAAAIASTASLYGTALLELWQKGLDLAVDDDTCPMCEAPTLAEAKRLEIRRRVTQGAEAITRNKALTEGIASTTQSVNLLSRAAGRVGQFDLDAASRSLLRKLMPDVDDQICRYEAACDKVVSCHANLNQVLAKIRGEIADLQTLLGDPSQAQAVVRLMVEASTNSATAVREIDAAISEYRSEWATFEPLLTIRIASHDAVERIDALGKTLKVLPALAVLVRYDRTLTETQELIRSVEGHLQTLQSELLRSRGGEVKNVYDLMNPHSEVGFDCMEPGNDQVKLHATSFGVRMPAAANLSECQLNCLGLAVWLMQATTPDSPFGFVVLDDPVQSMDDQHAEAFLLSVVPYLLETQKKQVIVLSHVQRITDRLRELHITRPHRHFHLDSYSRHGPVLVEQVKLAKMVAEIKGALAANESGREFAVDRLRVLTEATIRELHLRKTGDPLPSKFHNAQPKDLLQVFRTIPDVTQDEYAGLRDTVGFSDPAHHTEVGYSVPVASNIMPHLQRLEGLIKRHGLLQ